VKCTPWDNKQSITLWGDADMEIFFFVVCKIAVLYYKLSYRYQRYQGRNVDGFSDADALNLESCEIKKS